MFVSLLKFYIFLILILKPIFILLCQRRKLFKVIQEHILLYRFPLTQSIRNENVLQKFWIAMALFVLVHTKRGLIISLKTSRKESCTFANMRSLLEVIYLTFLKKIHASNTGTNKLTAKALKKRLVTFIGRKKNILITVGASD